MDGCIYEVFDSVYCGGCVGVVYFDVCGCDEECMVVVVDFFGDGGGDYYVVIVVGCGGVDGIGCIGVDEDVDVCGSI